MCPICVAIIIDYSVSFGLHILTDKRERERVRERERERESKRDVSCDVSDDDETMKPRGRKNCWKSSSDKNLITEQIAVVVRISTKEITHTRTG